MNLYPFRSTDYKFDLSVVAPCFNEEDNISTLVERIQQLFTRLSISGEIVLVNDASQDGTQEQIDIFTKKYNNIHSFKHEYNKGIFQGWVTGVGNASGRYVVIIDADMQYDPADIYTFYNEISKNEFDIIQGWRKNYHDTLLRNILKTGFSKLLGIMFNCRLHDIKSGFILCRKEIFVDILSYKFNYKFPQHYLTLSLISKQYTIKEVPITFNKRLAGVSFINKPIIFSLKALFELPKAFYEFRILNSKINKRV